ncbi:MAG: recombinase family protein [Anaerolineae bacterium]|nr:recombinase family protein [Anaerolineae bacterium]
MTLRAIIWCAVSTVAQANEEEKYSLPSQEADARAVCEKEGWQIVDVLKVPGHSRNYKSLDKLASDARIKGIQAFDQLIEHLENCDFDVLICRDANRFARKASLLHYIVESIIEDCGARIYSLNDGWVDATNADIFAMVKGYETSKQIKWLRDAAARGKDKLVENGLPTGSRIPISHTRVRDPVSGRDMGLVLNEALKPFWIDVATLILEGIAWNKMGLELYRRWGHVAHDGLPHRSTNLYETLHNPWFWGHSARLHTRHPEQHGQWVFNEAVPLPEGIKVARHKAPAVYTDELAERIKAELTRRMDIRGRANSFDTYKFSRIARCGECNGSMSVCVKHGRRRGLLCGKASKLGLHGERLCYQTRMIAEEKLQPIVHTMLETMLSGKTPDIMQPHNQKSEAAQARLANMETEITAAGTQMRTLIVEQSKAPEAAQPYYREQIQTLAQRIEILKQNHSSLKHSLLSEARAIEVQKRTLEEIRGITLDGFWECPDREINQYLRRLLGNKRLVVRDTDVTGMIVMD